jgi:hypothetical protein
MVMAGQMFGKRPVGKPKTRWMDAVKEDSYQILNWRNWERRQDTGMDRGQRSRRPRPTLGCSAIVDDTEKWSYIEFL